MSDFFQPGVITTLHRFKKGNLERMEMELEFYTRHHPTALVLPSLYSELKEKELKAIVSEIQKVKYINQIIITLGRASENSEAIVLHDCDIVNYDREFLARLCYPVVNPNLGYEFCKGYYSRVTNKMHGRVTRLFVTPLIRSLERLLG